MSDDEEQPAKGRKRSHQKYVDEEFDEDDRPKKVTKSRAKRATAHASSDSIVDDDVPPQEEEDIYQKEDQFTEFEAGQIIRVYVQDFMCHHKLTIDFGRHVNFVTGANGSGKKCNQVVHWDF